MIDPEDWVPTDGLILEPNALDAVREVERSVVLTAGPGAGKTETLAQRVDFLLTTGTSPYPARVLAISAKVDAASNVSGRVRSRSGYQLARRLDSQTFHSFAKRIIDQYRVQLQDQDALDPDYIVGSERIFRRQIRFADMIPLATKIVRENYYAKSAIQRSYFHVLMDEFQDCTGPQYELIKECFSNTSTIFTGVGDSKQRIMGFAGALEGIFATFADDFDALPLILFQNRRSAPHLRRFQNEVVRRIEPIAAVDPGDIKGVGGRLEVRYFDSDLDESSYVAERIQSWISDDGVAASDIAVLVAKQPELYSVEVAAQLSARGIPFRNESSMQDLVAEPLFNLLSDYLHIVFGDAEPEAYQRFMDLMLSKELDAEEEEVLVASWQDYFNRARKYAIDRTSESRADLLKLLVRDLLRQTGPDFVRTLSPSYEHGDYIASVWNKSIERIVAVAERSGSIKQSLSEISANEAVRILTVHKAKGLEFDSVVVLAVENELYWPEKLAEERAAFFVAISRAKQSLLLTAAKFRSRPAAANWRWKEARTPQAEFIAYATPFL